MLNFFIFSSNDIINISFKYKYCRFSKFLKSQYTRFKFLLLIENGADVNKEDKDGNTPLIEAVMGNNESIIRFLIENGADVNKENRKGNTPLIETCDNYKDNENIIRLLIENGADVNKEGKNGDTPLIVTHRKGNENIKRLLIENGALSIDKKKLNCDI